MSITNRKNIFKILSQNKQKPKLLLWNYVHDLMIYEYIALCKSKHLYYMNVINKYCNDKLQKMHGFLKSFVLFSFLSFRAR